MQKSLSISILAMLLSAGMLLPQDQVWVCPMDPDVRSSVAGVCPRCGMKLTDKVPEATEYHMDLSTLPRLLQVGLHDASAYARPFVLPPGTPKERVQILRKAFQETLKDKAFLAEAEKAKLGVDPVTGEELERMVAGLSTLDPGLLAKLKEVLFN